MWEERIAEMMQNMSRYIVNNCYYSGYLSASISVKAGQGLKESCEILKGKF